MAILNKFLVPGTNTPTLPSRPLETETDPYTIQAFLTARGLMYQHLPVSAAAYQQIDQAVQQQVTPEAFQTTVLNALEETLQPLMTQQGYQRADVIAIAPDMLNLQALRDKFLAEHTHAEDEVRYFIEGRGHFWYHLNTPPFGEEVFCITAEAGDLVSVPAGTTHWFELDADPYVRVVRLFTNPEGWVANYTESAAEKPYLNQTLTQQFENIRAVLMDVEGTTTDIAFVHDVLFPYAKVHTGEFLRTAVNHASDAVILDALIQTLHTMQQEGTLQEELTACLQDHRWPTPPALEPILATLLGWIEADRKHPALKTLQGLLWETGYAQGDYQGHVYPDVLPCWQAWRKAGIQLGIYSSGSVLAQKLLFANSTAGDLTPHLTWHFDTQVGAKQEPTSYHTIAQHMGIEPSQILFLSDVLGELTAARTAGFQVAQLVRPNTPTARATDKAIPRIPSFRALLYSPLPHAVGV